MDKTRPVTSYLMLTCFFLFCFANIILYFCEIISFDALSEILYCFYIGWTGLPNLILAILEHEEPLADIFMYIIIAAILCVYIILPVIAHRKKSKGINGVLIVILSFDILFSFMIVLAVPLGGIINIILKCILILFCALNIKWYNENY